MEPTEPTELEKLLMHAEKLSNLMDPQPWVTLAEKLSKASPPDTSKDNVTHLCAVYYRHGQQRQISSYLGSDQQELVTETVDFLEKFMKARGQWGYIEKQLWYTRGDYYIGIDINYYGNRPASTYAVTPQFHKDTGGNNIFVNLIFDNKGPIEATEWFVDIAEPSDRRTEWQAKLLPPEHLRELAALRKVLRDKHADKTSQVVVKGGVLEDPNIYLAWVDDLIWHATPSQSKRIAYSKEAAIAAWEQFQGSGYYQDPTTGATITFYEVVATMAEEPTTAVAEWLRSRKKRVQDIDYELGYHAWQALYLGEDGRRTYTSDATKRAAKPPWKLVGEIPTAIEQDKRLGASSAVIKEVPPLLSGLTRANSTDNLRLTEVAAQNRGKPRTFIRTWVRILRKDDPDEYPPGTY